eukprot:2738155-Prymnesium_polylepis.2
MASATAASAARSAGPRSRARRVHWPIHRVMAAQPHLDASCSRGKLCADTCASTTGACAGSESIAQKASWRRPRGAGVAMRSRDGMLPRSRPSARALIDTSPSADVLTSGEPSWRHLLQVVVATKESEQAQAQDVAGGVARELTEQQRTQQIARVGGLRPHALLHVDAADGTREPEQDQVGVSSDHEDATIGRGRLIALVDNRAQMLEDLELTLASMSRRVDYDHELTSPPGTRSPRLQPFVEVEHEHRPWSGCERVGVSVWICSAFALLSELGQRRRSVDA